MVVDAARAGEAELAAEIAVTLTERGLGGDAVDLTRRLDNFRRDRSPRAEDARRLARNLAKRAKTLTPALSREAVEGGPPLLPHSPVRETEAFFRTPSAREKVADQVGRMRAVSPESIGEWLTAAFPDRIAMARGKRGEFLMANGRAAALEPQDALAGETFLAIGEIVGRAAAAQRIVTAAAADARTDRSCRGR